MTSIPQPRKSPRQQRSQQTVDTILQATARVLAKHGYAGTNTNRIAETAGVSVGSLYQYFPNKNALIAALHDRHDEQMLALIDTVLDGNPAATLRERVAAIVDLMYDGLTAPESRAIETLRAALPRDPDELRRMFPKTAAEFASWGPSWIDSCQRAFADLDVDPERVREVAAFLPGAMRGLVSEKQLGNFQDQQLARRGLARAIVALLAG